MVNTKEQLLIPSNNQDIIFLCENIELDVKIYVLKEGLRRWILKKAELNEIVIPIRRLAQDLTEYMSLNETIDWKEFMINSEIKRKAPQDCTLEKYRSYIAKERSINYDVKFLIDNIIDYNIETKSIAIWDEVLQLFIPEIDCQKSEWVIFWEYKNLYINCRVLKVI